jgi:rSAM/selenodomain-associated transferase 1
VSETLAIMAKAPREGQVKTRLRGALGSRRATALYACMLADTFGLAARARSERGGLRVALCYAPEDAAAELAAMGLGYDRAFAQRGADLGARLANCFRDALGAGAEAVVVAGADSPTLPVERVAEAFDALAGGADVVLGPTEDGGYYLVGARRLHEPLFRDVAWSTDRVLAVTLERARSHGLGVRLLEPWYDVDEPADLDRLRRDAAPGSACRAFLDESPRSRAR